MKEFKTNGGYTFDIQALEHYDENSSSAVYYTKEITPDALCRIYSSLGRKASGKVAVKLSTGEAGGHYYLSPDLIKSLVQSVGATIVECNTAYGGSRATADIHMNTARDHGFTDISDVDIMDADGGMNIPVSGGRHLKQNLVGAHLANYDFVMVLSHFKGHIMGGFGGALKNISIGIAASKGKSLIHSAGKERSSFEINTPMDDFTEAMAEAAKSVSDYEDSGRRMIYINVVNNLSVDCDCDSNPTKPTMKDIGIAASLDPVALDQACVDIVYALPDSADLRERMESRRGIHILEHAEAIGLGSRAYKLCDIDE